MNWEKAFEQGLISVMEKQVYETLDYVGEALTNGDLSDVRNAIDVVNDRQAVCVSDGCYDYISYEKMRISLYRKYVELSESMMKGE